jgi:hypothetical protein
MTSYFTFPIMYPACAESHVSNNTARENDPDHDHVETQIIPVGVMVLNAHSGLKEGVAWLRA